MKGLKTLCSQALGGCAILLAFFGQVNLSHAQTLYMTNGNSVVGVDPFSGQGLTTWLVDGVDQAQRSWYWWRVGNSGPEQVINTIGAVTNSQPALNRLNTLYSGNYSVQVNFTLTGGAADSGVSTLSETIRIINNTSVAADFHFFEFSDFDISDYPSNQTVQINGQYEVVQNYNGRLLTHLVSPAATRAEASLNFAPIASLEDANPTTLSNVLSASGAGDASYALQWDFTIPAFGSQLMSVTYQVPEPGTLALGLLGILGWAMMRRR